MFNADGGSQCRDYHGLGMTGIPEREHSMPYRVILQSTKTRVKCGEPDGDLSGNEAIENIELYRDRIVLACNRAIEEIKSHSDVGEPQRV